jgi:hypothetical protein
MAGQRRLLLTAPAAYYLGNIARGDAAAHCNSQAASGSQTIRQLAATEFQRGSAAEPGTIWLQAHSAMPRQGAAGNRIRRRHGQADITPVLVDAGGNIVTQGARQWCAPSGGQSGVTDIGAGRTVRRADGALRFARRRAPGPVEADMKTTARAILGSHSAAGSSHRPPQQSRWATPNWPRDASITRTAVRGEAVVFLHAGSGNSLLFEQQTAPVAGGFRFITHDRAGQGRSARATRTPAPPELEQLMDHLGVQRLSGA